MAWSTPKTWTSEPLTSLDLNTYVRDNQNHLKDRLDNSASAILSGSGNYNTTSTAWVDIDASKLSLTLTTNGGDILIGFTGSIQHSRDAGRTNFNISVDGTNYFAVDGMTQFVNSNQNDVLRYKSLAICVLITNLAAGSHTFRLRWKTSSNNTATIETAATRPQFWAKEI